jgi:hypothetical protein
MNMHSPAPQVKLDDRSGVCEQCDTPFAKRKGSGGSAQRFCSAQCRQASHTNAQRGQRNPACDAATPPAATPIADPVKVAAEACEARLAVLIKKEDEDRFDWFEEDLVLEDQRPVAIYYNKRNHLVIRQEGWGGDDDAFVTIAPQNIPWFIEQLRGLVGKK